MKNIIDGQLALMLIESDKERVYKQKKIEKNIVDELKESISQYGTDYLPNRLLLAAVLNPCNRKTKFEIADLINDDLEMIVTMTVAELTNLVGERNAVTLKMIYEVGKRLNKKVSKEKHKISSPGDAANLLMEDMRYLKKEQLRLVMLNTKNQIIKIDINSIGSLNSSVVHPREVFTEAIRNSASSIIIAHNHPSGDPSPSQDDINITKRLYEVGKLVGIDLLDHVIIGDGKYISLKEKGII
jgi:DNA repair protein RadC